MATLEMKLYKNTKLKNHTSRLITAVAALNVPETNIETFDLLDPVIVVKNSDYQAIANGKSNYMHLGAPFNRYYFMGTATAGEDGMTRIPCHVDVLYTYLAEALNADVIAKRSSSNFDIGLQDDMVQYKRGYVYNFSKFNYIFRPEAGQYILQVGGR